MGLCIWNMQFIIPYFLISFLSFIGNLYNINIVFYSIYIALQGKKHDVFTLNIIKCQCVIDMVPVHKHFLLLFVSVKQLGVNCNLICMNLPWSEYLQGFAFNFSQKSFQLTAHQTRSLHGLVLPHRQYVSSSLVHTSLLHCPIKMCFVWC